MKYLLAVLSFVLMSSPVWAVSPSNDDFAKAAVITGSPVALSVGSISKGGIYVITVVGTTDFTAIGADSNFVDTVLWPQVQVRVNPTNDRKFAVTITPRTGLFSGSFILTDGRKVTLEGVLLQLPSPTLANQFGRGFFSVPPVKTVPATGSIQSGNVIFTGPAIP